MAHGFVDRLLTIVVTATLTSAVWIVVGSSYLDPEGGPGISRAEPDEASSAAPGGSPKAAPSSVAISAPMAGETAGLVVPVQGVAAAQLADTFDDERGGGTRLHEALDIMAPTGTPVVATGAGTIERLFQSDAGGNTIYVRSPDRETIHYYAHLEAYATGLREGQQVRRGQRLGTVGSSGNADPAAPHLHFAILRTTPDAEWWEPATALNPYPLLRQTAR